MSDYTQTAIPMARLTDPSTSHEAAASVNDVRTSQRFIYGMIRALGGATDEELVRRVKSAQVAMSESGIRTRRSELVRLGLIVDSGARKRTASGRRSIVWVVAE